MPAVRERLNVPAGRKRRRRGKGEGAEGEERSPAKEIEEEIRPGVVYRVAKAAKLLDIAPRRLSLYLRSGFIKGQKKGGDWFILGQALIDFCLGVEPVEPTKTSP